MKQIIIKSVLICCSILLVLLAASCDTNPSPDANTDSEAATVVADKDTSLNGPLPPTTNDKINYAPDFAVLDKDGNTVKLSDFRGKPVVINFWATWCPPCKQELPDFNKAAETYKDDVVFLMVNLTDGQRDTVNVVKAFVADNGYTFPVYFDTSYSAANAYSISSIPATYFINAKGEVVSYKVGMMTADELDTGIKLLTE